MKLIRDIRAAGIFHKAVKSMQAGDYQGVLDRLDGFQAQPYFLAKAELFRAMARHRQDRFAEAVHHYDNFLTNHLADMPPKDRVYVEEYGKFFRSRAQARLDPSTPLYLSLEELRKLAENAPFLTRAEFTFGNLAEADLTGQI
ncbi:MULTISPECIES: hypothetical protein [unclassified Ruegeria]|uniref:hypothetical protein n=1 Tax=unclassified Ruegeria TaxID=2625375 RepID=UPI00149123E1|nr:MULTISPECIES: hypothetical protein [unclassified Ruegeria]NOD86649.1 hypothetical protein [Ruegeria sp. HKCCD6119]UUV05509.1 hypothetical protein NOR97_12885 [Ruegeria sp. YS9]